MRFWAFSSSNGKYKNRKKLIDKKVRQFSMASLVEIEPAINP